MYTKSSQRFVMYIPNNLREEIDDLVDKRGITLAEFGRDAFETYLNSIKEEERKAQLAETCRLFEAQNDDLSNLWAGEENGNWPK
jgi:metal-responsive CopG/Arc/MetJ family transcriptional regulator